MDRLLTCITSDLVASRESLDRSDLQRRVEAVLREVNQTRPDLVVVPLAVVLGDEWQGLAPNPAAAFALDFEIRRRLHPWGIRTGLGVGPVSTAYRPRSGEMDGPCFHRSRAALEAAKRRTHPMTVFDSGHDPLDDLINGIERLIHAVRNDWTARQFEVVMEYHDQGTETAAARALGVTQPTVHRSLAGAHGKDVLHLMGARDRFLTAQAPLLTQEVSPT